MTDRFELAHFSDSHLGYEAYQALTSRGLNQRGVDVVRAFKNVCDDITAADPPLVIHSGDVAERPRVDYRYLLAAMSGFAELAGIRPDGTRRQVVVIAGNHELPRKHMEACWLDLLRRIPGLHIITNRYELVRFNAQRDGSDPALDDVVVHGLPHDNLKTVDFAAVQPLEGLTNVLTAHGVAGGSELFTRSLGREYHIPTDVLLRDWAYVALGHWHKRGPVTIGGTADDTSRIWYAGSSENISFRDLRDNEGGRGWLHVKVAPTFKVTPRDIEIRRMFRLPVVDGAGLEPDQVRDLLIERITGADVDAAVVHQIVTGVSRDLWALVDVPAVRAAARAALHYEISVRYASSVEDDDATTPIEHRGLGDIAEVLDERAGALTEAGTLSASIRDDVVALAKTLLADALGNPDLLVGTDDDTDDSTPAAAGADTDASAEGAEPEHGAADTPEAA